MWQRPEPQEMNDAQELSRGTSNLRTVKILISAGLNHTRKPTQVASFLSGRISSETHKEKLFNGNDDKDAVG